MNPNKASWEKADFTPSRGPEPAAAALSRLTHQCFSGFTRKRSLAEISRDLAHRRIVIPAAPSVPRTLRPSFHDPDWAAKLEITCIDAQASGGTLV
jgi:hypothetical protein